MATNGQCRTTPSWSTSYDSIADFVDEVSVLPPKTRWTSQSGVSTSNGASPPCGNSTVTGTTTNSYDGQGRLARSVSNGGSASLITIPPGNANVYTEWDVFGRPTAYANPIGFAVSPVRISYDDSAHTRSTVNPAFANTTIVDTFDANGNLARHRRVSRTLPPPVSGLSEFVETRDTTFVIGATTRVCR